ncbi:hypothetical protein OAF87_02725 [Akkermansiaceae bacterium]|nr:hypothetical protein [Akkermansiaceae bacterium]MDB4630650.1 hypothetical protein [Akkermansiaceae bacterium]MDB4740713.1 hypothetical protein [Akkermansiaceae bacterium]MDB4800438.1 hypothetical protein [bacterium]
MSVIDEELAKKFMKAPDNVDLSEATEITDEAAEILGTYERGWIRADGLKSLFSKSWDDRPRNLVFTIKNLD